MPIKWLLTNTAWALGAHLLNRGSLVVASMLLAREFPVNWFSEYSYFQLTATVIAGYAAMGMGIAATRALAAIKGEHGGSDYPIGTLWLLTIFAAICLAIALGASPLMATLEMQSPRWMLPLAIVIVAAGTVPTGGILGLECYALAAAISFLSASVLILGTLASVITASLNIALASLILSQALQAGLSSWFIVRLVGFASMRKRIIFSASAFRELFRTAGPLALVSILSISGSWLVGTLIAKGTNGSTEFATYAIGLQWYALASFLPGMVSRILLPRLVRAGNAATVNHQTRELVRLGVKATMVSAALVCIVAAALSQWIMSLYGMHRESDIYVLLMFIVAALSAAPANTLGNAIVAKGGEKVWLTLTILWFLAIVAIPTLDTSRSAFAGAASHVIAAVVLTVGASLFARRKRLI